MRTTLILAVGLALAVLALWLARDGASPVHPTSPEGDARAAPYSAEQDEPALAAQDVREPEPVQSLRADVAAIEQLEGESTTRVHGRVVDVDGVPIAGAQLTLGAWGGPWAQGVTPPVELPREARGFRVSSHADGHYELTVPTPSAERVWLAVEASPFLMAQRVEFGEGGFGALPPLRPGELAIETFRLGAAGVIEGLVTSTSGGPLEGARLRVHFESRSLYLGDETDASGRYRIEHVPPGVHELHVSHSTHLLQERTGIEVGARRVTAAVDFELDPAPILRGIVTDERGVPLAGIFIQAWPVSSGRGGTARTDADGSFTIHLPQDEPYLLEIEQTGFRPYGGHGSSGTTFPQGTDDIRVVLEREVETTFLVVDVDTDEPVERFALAIGERPRNLRVEDHPGGTAARFARPGEHVWVIEAPGYAPRQGPVEPDEEGGSLQTLRLERGGAIAGRVTSSGAPAAHASIVSSRSHVKLDPDQPDLPPEEALWSEAYGFDVGAFEGRERTQAATVDGAFRFEHLTPGHYRLEITPAEGAPSVIEPVLVTAGETADLGEVALSVGGRIEGVVLAAGGAPAKGVEVMFGPWGDSKRVTDAEGRFCFEHLAAGMHHLTVAASAGVLAEDRGVEVEVRAGETARVEVDLGDATPCRLSIRVLRRGDPAAGVRVLAIDTSGRERDLGATDAEGALVGACPPLGSAQLAVLSPSGLRLGAARAPQPFSPGGFVDADLEIDPGELELLLPEGFEPIVHGHVGITLADPDGTPPPPWPRAYQHPGVLVGAPMFFLDGVMTSSACRWEGRRVDLGHVAAGRYVVKLQARSHADAESMSQGKDADHRFYEGEVEVAPGRAATCELREVERGF